MNDLDFLPAQYRQQNLRRKSRPWQIGAVIVFAVLLAVAEYSQRCRCARVRADLKAIGPRYQEALNRQERLADVQSRLAPMRASAELLAFLRHPWPRTQLLAAVVEPLPEEITLEELDIRRVQEKKAPRERRASAEDEKQRDSLPAAARDLQSLRQECNEARVVVSLKGRTGDSAAVHRYLGHLARHPLIAKAELGSVEHLEQGGSDTLEFQASLLVRPGYGQPGGPISPPDPTEIAGASAGGPDPSAAPPTPGDAS